MISDAYSRWRQIQGELGRAASLQLVSSCPDELYGERPSDSAALSTLALLLLILLLLLLLLILLLTVTILSDLFASTTA